MEMPTPCQKCNELFDLLDGYPSKKWLPNVIICKACSIVEDEEVERDEEIAALKEEIEDAECTLKRDRARLAELEAV